MTTFITSIHNIPITGNWHQSKTPKIKCVLSVALLVCKCRKQTGLEKNKLMACERNWYYNRDLELS